MIRELLRSSATLRLLMPLLTGYPAWLPLLATALFLGSACKPRTQTTHSAPAPDASTSANLPDAKISSEICKPIERGVHPGKDPGKACHCGTAPRNIDARIVTVSYGLHPTNGTALRTVFPNGCVKGGHIGHGPGATGGDESGCVSSTCVTRVWKLAANVDKELASGKAPEGPKEDFAGLTLELADSKRQSVNWKLLEKAPTEQMQALARLMGTMEIGYW